MQRNDRSGQAPPVREGDEVDVKIDAIGEKGDGLTKINGFVMFVPDVKAGEHVRIKVKKVLNKVGFGEVIGRKEAPSSKDAEPEKVEKAKSEEELINEMDESEFTEDFGEDD